jgi:hypothetical protein
MQIPLRVTLAALCLQLLACGAEQYLRPLDAGPAPEDSNPIVQDVGGLDLPVETAAQGLASGAACTAANECESGFCADEVCCNVECTGPCLSCALEGSKGQCNPQAAATDPDNDCMDEGQTSCGLNGQCDGAGKCQRYPVNTTCAPATCLGTTFTVSGSCDDQGMCHKPAPITCGKFQCASTSACRTMCNANSDCVAPNLCIGGTCGGVTGQYFNTVDLTGAPVLTRVDPNIDFNWMVGSPAAAVHTDLFSVRWTGTLTPQFSETYTFYVSSNDGDRMFLDNTLVIDHFVDHTVVEDIGTRALVAGRSYQFRLEYYERYSTAEVHLSWSSPSQPKAIIPSSAFTPAP